jgi:glycosyltransferase involved in cell wall biosynthesis
LGDKQVLLFVGALTEWHGYKGLDILLRSFAIAKQRQRDLALVVVGDGNLKKRYQRLAAEMSVAQDVHFVGDVPDRILPEVYAACDIFVLPSKMAEGLPLVVLEALATSKPVIGTNVGGVPEVVRHSYNGLLVRPGDERTLARAILEISRNSKTLRWMGRNGRQMAERHDWSRVARKTEQVYEEALNLAT